MTEPATTLVVDLGDVACHYRPQRRLDALAAATGHAPEDIHAAIFGSGLEAMAESGDFTTATIVDVLLDGLGRGLDREGLISAWHLAFEPATEILDIVRSWPGPKALFTNNGPMLDLCLEGPLEGVAAEFDHVLCSWHLRARKPDAVAFERAADLLDMPPDQLLLLDDSEPNVVAARAAGWRAAYTTGPDDVRRALAGGPPASAQ